MKNWDIWGSNYVNSIGFERDYRRLHSHDYDEVSLIIQGDIKYVSDSINAHVTGKSLIFSKAYHLHNPYVCQDKPYERYQISFRHSWLDERIIANERSNMESFIVSLDNDDFNEIFGYMQQLYKESQKNDELTELKRKFLLNSLFVKIIDVYVNSSHDCNQITKTYISDVLMYVEHNYEKKLLAEDVAACFFVSRTKFMQDFRSQTGMTFLNYINLIRIKHAKEYLRNGYSVTATAELCGFSNSGHLIKVFSDLNNTTPLKYQKSYIMNFE